MAHTQFLFMRVSLDERTGRPGEGHSWGNGFRTTWPSRQRTLPTRIPKRARTALTSLELSTQALNEASLDP
jgi:hypothetical protein